MLSRWPTKEREVLLTFDDGPTEYLPEILRILQVFDQKATFFWLGSRLTGQTPVQQVLQEGHVIGTHGWSHQRMNEWSKEEQEASLCRALEEFERFGTLKPAWFRPPYGLFNEWTFQALENTALRMMHWSHASWDWALEDHPGHILQNMLEHVKPGSIVLLHELPQTVQILPDILNGLLERQYDLIVPSDYFSSIPACHLCSGAALSALHCGR